MFKVTVKFWEQTQHWPRFRGVQTQTIKEWDVVILFLYRLGCHWPELVEVINVGDIVEYSTEEAGTYLQATIEKVCKP